MESQKWIVVSNRLPFSYDSNKNKLVSSSGGLVTALKGIKSKSPIQWIGAIQNNIPPSVVSQIKDINEFQMRYTPIEVNEDLYNSYYNDFCNDVLWPLFHYETEMLKYTNEAWESYYQVNKLFADKILEVATENDLIWIHDFHLFLVSGLLKEANPKLKVGFFLHIPFPTSEIYRHLPVRNEILQSLVQADLIGFHDYSYLRHFTSSVYNVLGVTSSLLTISHNNHKTNLGVFPVSIDTQDFIDQAESDKTKESIKNFHLKDGNHIRILGIDRLDYSKGIELKFLAFKKLLTDFPEMRGKVKFFQVAIPSRTDVIEYKKLKENIDQLISEINGEFSTPNYIPIQYMFNTVPFNDLMALYRTSNVLFVGSKRDGMNLVSLEYIVTQDPKNPGVVVLSEFAGAISTLSHVLKINPWDISETSTTLYKAITMKKEERIKKHKTMYKYLKSYTANKWATFFMKELDEKVKNMKIQKTSNLTIQHNFIELSNKIRNKKIVLMIDYDGTLSPIVDDPNDAILSIETMSILDELKSKHEVIIVTGRPVNFIKDRFPSDNFEIAAEHGGIFFSQNDKQWHTLVNSGKEIWYNEALQIMDDYSQRTPESFIEKKDYSLSWHYRKSPQSFATFQSRKLLCDLESGLANFPVNFIQGKKIIEVKSIEANKGVFANWYYDNIFSELSDKKCETIFIAIGDDRTDEDLFSAINKHGITIKVGEEDTSAMYRLNSQEEVNPFLKNLLIKDYKSEIIQSDQVQQTAV